MKYHNKYFGITQWSVCLLCIFWFQSLAAQGGRPSKPVASPAQRAPAIAPDTVKIPRFSVRFGPYRADMPLVASEIAKAIHLPLVVTDQAGTPWTILTYRLGWRRLEPSDDIKTGKRKIIQTFNAIRVDSSGHIPVAWQNELKEYLKKGEQLIFEQIIAEHPLSKRKMMPPDLVLEIKH